MTIKRTNFTLSPLYQPRALSRRERVLTVHNAGVWGVQVIAGVGMVIAGVGAAVVLMAFGG